MKNMELIIASLLTTIAIAKPMPKKCYNYVECKVYEEELNTEADRRIPCKYHSMPTYA